MTTTVESIVTDVGTVYSAVPHLFGWQELEARSAPPRIVWDVGDEDNYIPTQWPGDECPLWVVQTQVEINIWAIDDTALETMRQAEISAIHEVLHGSYRIIRGRRGPGNREWTGRGRAYTLTISIDQPICQVPLVELTTIEGVLHSNEMTISGSTEKCGHDVEED